MAENLWPDIDIADAPPSPKSVIEEAGSGLSDKTKGRVKFTTMNTDVKEGAFRMQCSLYAPRLTYHYPFLEAKFPVGGHYPVEITADKIATPFIAKDAEHLKTVLAIVFQSKTTIETVKGLLALSR